MNNVIFLKKTITQSQWMYVLMTAMIIFIWFPTFVLGEVDFGNALEFDGNDDNVDCGQSDVTNITGTMTIEAWIKPYTKNSNLTIVGNTMSGLNNPGYAFDINSWNTTDRKIGFESYDDFKLTEDSAVAYGQWQHVAISISGTAAQIYVNGEAKNVTGPYPDLRSSSNNLFIGARSDKFYVYQGQIDELRIWSDVRTQQEISGKM